MSEETLVTQPEEKSMFHEGSNQIRRIDDIRNDSKRYATQGDFKNWKIQLDRMFIELSADIIELDDGKTFLDYFNTGLDKDLFDIEKKYEKLPNIKKNAIYKHLSNWEITIRTLQKKVGKGGKYFDPTSDDID